MWVSVVPMVTLAFLGGGGGSTVHAQERFFSAFAAGDVKDQEQALHPSADGLWYDLDETTQFQPAPLLRHRDLQQSDGSSSYAQSSLFQDSLDTYYDPYQTAWRYLGFYVDCSPFDTTYDSQDYRQRVRHLEQNNNNNNNNGGVNYQQQHRCRRYLLWAAVCIQPTEQGHVRRVEGKFLMLFCLFVFLCSLTPSLFSFRTYGRPLFEKLFIKLILVHVVNLFHLLTGNVFSLGQLQSSTLIWIIKVEELGNIKSTMSTSANGIKRRVKHDPIPVVPRWIVTNRVRIGSCWVSIRNWDTPDGLNNFSNIKDSVFGTITNYPSSCTRIGMPGPEPARKPVRPCRMVPIFTTR